MRIVVTGREGQVVSSLIERAAGSRIDVVAIGRPDLDLTRPETIASALAAAGPDLVVSAAAYTAVDQAEDEPELAFAINATGAGHVADAAANIGVPIIHLSTDYVFDGEGEGPYAETATPAPRSIYGASKLAGERAVGDANPRHFILRTAWVYSPYGKNFVKTMLRLAADRDQVSIVSDQWGNPTSALDIADGILHMAARLQDHADAPPGIYHLAGTGETNWSGFARAIFKVSSKFSGPSAIVKDIATSDYPTKARRPANSRLSTDHFMKTFEWKAPHWQTSAAETVQRLLR